ncbi:Zinc finger BED domain-containing protein RICESLEEPER 3 [Glycine max]|nr:Zinc finger BED domain-containing protein RICESLEEPER 3 [Glycine max]
MIDQESAHEETTPGPGYTPPYSPPSITHSPSTAHAPSATPNESTPAPEAKEIDDNLEGTTKIGTDNARKELASAIIMHEYPLSIVDHVGFRRYSIALQPVFQVSRRNTIKKEIFMIHQEERSIALKLLASLQGRVAITSNMWIVSEQ